MVLPCEDPYLRAIATQRPPIRTRSTEYLPCNVEEVLASLLEAEVWLHVNLEQLKKELESCHDFSVRRLFKAIDEPRFKFLTEGTIRLFLRRMGHQPLKSELIAIIRRFDLDGDSRLSFSEFCEALRPISPDLIHPREELTFVPNKRLSPSKERPSPQRIEIQNEFKERPKRTKSAEGGESLRKKHQKRSLF